MKFTTEQKIVLTLFLIAIYFPIFLHLDMVSLYLWDEATNALQAYEMSLNGNFLRRYFQNQPDTWETKPPLLIWLQVISIKIFGYNELAIRMPSAMATLATVLVILRFFIKELKFFIGGIFSGIILLCSAGYVCQHVSRTGDHDALLIFFLTTGLLYFYKYLKYDTNKNKYLAIFTTAFILGVLTKSITGLFFGPGLLIYTLTQKKLVPTLKSSKFWLSIFSFFLVVGGYYLINEIKTPCYLFLVWENELFPRFFNTAETYSYNDQPSSFHYIKMLIKHKFRWFYMLIPLSLLLIFNKKDQNLSLFTLITTITAFIFLFIVSNGTYNGWYDAPVYPLLAMICGAGLGLLYQLISKYMNLKHSINKLLLPLSFIIAFFLFPYKSIILDECYLPKGGYEHSQYGNLLKQVKKNNSLKDIVVFTPKENRHLLFYENVFNKKHGYRIEHCIGGHIIDCTPPQKIMIGEHIMVCDKNLNNEIANRFETSIIEQYQNCYLYIVEGYKLERQANY